MIHSTDFSKRIQQIIDYYNLNASSFAEKIGVQRSSISHILSGRNKPSLDFIMKILSSFGEVDIYWLLNGKGNFPSLINTKTSLDIKNVIKENSNSEKEIDRIVIFFKDGTFKNYNN
jgi:transcriptional regulator with XRE-family HTH domain